MRRCFIVGSPRSGTTLVQALLASHPQVWSLPETHFFRRLEPYRVGPRGLLVSPSADELLREVSGAAGVAHSFRPRWLTVGECVRRFAAILDYGAAAQGASAWVEKTPGHLHYIALITRFLPDAGYVHVTRRGADVVASVVRVTREHAAWDGARSIEQAAARWRGDIDATRKYVGATGHAIVRYEDVAADAEDALAPAWRLLGVERASIDHRTAATGLIESGEVWKRGLQGPIAASSRLHELTPQERALISALVDEADPVAAGSAPPVSA